MPIIVAEIDTDALKISVNDVLKFIRNSSYSIKEPEVKYSNHRRDMTKGWEKLGSVAYWNSTIGPNIPGTYALVLDLDNIIDNPVTWNQTILFGETTQEAWKRLATHVLSLIHI